MDTLPDNYTGNSYFYNGRYYSGGTYQTGRYQYGGNPYTERYFYNGRYYYGGKYQNHSSNVTIRPGYKTGANTYQNPNRSTTRPFYGNRRD